ncbi:SpoVT/AbrB domain-containing protein (plasmid) [Deinococcus proteolyticus MRP]|uniref:SpoVT/AbrB domain-containing protein n=1 Tax=Deinococcus proteolyticus (strain ATCC 35074 / DSM 20540 / JCM 6276 / NBRC 101906 / NCIMB 13154 / VKM Ac-1939 / CCM 2703 / MRP) TaxID=693977 RepID=F0RR36_DEIPM|nr:antitoxin [Deinococcus proteolyticus]ADY27745.1 SpoVT/AbrB domain-containing protein [Deinococcus proteolyticus MRP]
MHKTYLRKVGGSVMLSIPPALLDVLELTAGTAVGLNVEGGQLTVQPAPKPRYSLEELLAQCDLEAQCDPAGAQDAEEQHWLSDAPVGRELL